MPSSEFIRTLLGREQSDPLLILLTIEHAEIGAPIRVVRNAVGSDIVSNGETFTAFPFDIDIATDTDGAPRASINLMSVDRRIGNAILNLKTPPQIAFETILASAPDRVETRYARFKLRNITIDAVIISGELSQVEYSGEPWPNKRVLPSTFPAIFRSA